MRAYTLMALLSVTAAGCSGTSDGQTGTPSTDEPTQIGQTQQKSQFADGTVLNLVDPGNLFNPNKATLKLTADGDPVTVQVFYIGDKTTDTQHIPSTAVLVDTLSIASDQTVLHNINLNHAAFNGGYGSILVDAIGVSPTNVFQTYIEYDDSIFSVGGSVFQGSSYRIPYESDTRKMVLVFTNQSDFQYDLLIANIGGVESKTITMVPLTTYKFDSQAEGFNLNQTSSIQVFTQAGGTVAVSGYIVKRLRPLEKFRLAPVKAAPFL